MSSHRLESLMREAYGSDAGCYPPEALLDAAMKGLSTEERARLAEHVERCPACSAERDLAREFEASPQRMSALGEDLDHVTSRLRAHGRAAEPARRPLTRFVWGFGLAAAGIACAAIGLFLNERSSPPALPRLGLDPVVRGGRVEVVEPRGSLEAAPRTLRWVAVPDARAYRVRILEVDDTVLFESVGETPSVELPERVRGQLLPAVEYAWRVEALDAKGALLGATERVPFKIEVVAPRGGR